MCTLPGWKSGNRHMQSLCVLNQSCSLKANYKALSTVYHTYATKNRLATKQFREMKPRVSAHRWKLRLRVQPFYFLSSCPVTWSLGKT